MEVNRFQLFQHPLFKSQFEKSLAKAEKLRAQQRPKCTKSTDNLPISGSEDLVRTKGCNHRFDFVVGDLVLAHFGQKLVEHLVVPFGAGAALHVFDD